MASKRYGTIYTGVTSNLIQRTYQHREGLVEGFTKQYHCKILVWYELHATMESAIMKEKRLKKYPRQWKINVINQENCEWHDLWRSINGLPGQAGQ